MKIFQINTTLNWGSTGRIAEEIGILIQEKGNESYIAYGRFSNPSQSKIYHIGNKFDFFYHAIQTRLYDKHGLASQKATKKLINYIKEVQPDIIHLHNIHGYYVNYKILFDYLSKVKIPIVWTLHDCWSFTGHCAYYSFIKCNRWETGCHHCVQKKSYPATYLFDNSLNNFKKKKKVFTSLNRLTIVPVSNWLAEEVKKSFLNEYPIHVIHNGIDLDVFKPNTNFRTICNTNNSFTILGVASVWEKRKGLTDFIQLRSYLSNDYTIILVGLSKQQIEKLPQGIIGIQRTNCIQELVDLYSAADVFFNPTWEDNFPTTNLEALACGTPVITYKTGGSVEAIDEQTGFVVEQGDLETTVQILKRLKSEGKEKYKFPCRQRAVRLYNKNERYEEYIQLYNSLLK